MKKVLFQGILLASALSITGFADEKAPAPPEATIVPTDLFHLPEGLEVTVWATGDQLRNPTNIDIDEAGRIWVAEGVRYRHNHEAQPEGDRIQVLTDTDGDGKADKSHTFVQDPELIAPLGVAVVDNRVLVSQPPHLLSYTDVNRNQVFDEGVDKKEVLLTGFNGLNHDHSLHSLTVGPDGKFYFNQGNCGAKFTDRSGKTFTIFGSYRAKPVGGLEDAFSVEDMAELAGQVSDDGHVYVGGFTVRMNPDGTDAEIIGHNYRNSYEQSITSLGDVFQNDNDDPPACRVSWVMEHANFGFSSNDGQRTWRADRRPGQETAIAEWRQEDPGSMPAGDVYGGGSPTGNVFYENGALPAEMIGSFFACEPGRNVIFGYQPRLDGSGFALDRTDFITTNPGDDASRFAGSDFNGGDKSMNQEVKTLFRPSDIAVGPDGALYISDWFDPRVGGHRSYDEATAGTIYRVAPKGFQPKVPEIDRATTEGLITALLSPAVNVRAIGFYGLKEQGAKAIPAVKELLKHENPYIQGRALYLLYALGEKGIAAAGMPNEQASEEMTIAAYRALQRIGGDFVAEARQLADHASSAVRREVAVSLRDVNYSEKKDLLLALAESFAAGDRIYLEALGTATKGNEAELYRAIQESWGEGNPATWSPRFAQIAWRLHPIHAVSEFATRALTPELSYEDRKQAMDGIAFVFTDEASKAMVKIASSETDLKVDASWWLLNRATNRWKEFGLMEELKRSGIYDPETITISPITVPAPPATDPYTLEDVLALDGDAARGKLAVGRCVMCHEIDGQGINYGPTLDGWGKGQPLEVIARSIIHPTADIAHGYTGMRVTLKDGTQVDGLVVQRGDPTITVSTGGVRQLIPKNRIKHIHKKKQSLMLSAAQLGMTAQDVADAVAYLKTGK